MASLRRALQALFRPDRAFAEWRPSLGVALAIVVALAALNTAGMLLASEAVSGSVTGTDRIANPEYPGEDICGNDLPIEPADCDEPARVERSLSTVADDRLDRLVPRAAWATLLGWFALLALGSVTVRERAELDGVVAISAWALLPAALRYAARPIAVDRALADWTQPETVEGVQEGVAAMAAAPPVGWYEALVVATIGWQIALYVFALGAWRDLDRGEVAVVVGGPVAIAAWIGLGGGARLLQSEPVGFSVVLAVFGLLLVVVPRELVAIETSVELIGMRGRESVEPREWYVRFHRFFGATVLLGAHVFVGGMVLG